MNKKQKEIQQLFLDNEKAVLKKLEANYQDALFEINDKIERLLARKDADMQHVIYQIEYQKALKSQIQSILETLHNNEFETVSEYLAKSYEDGYIGVMYDLQGQGIPVVVPIDQEQVAIAIQHETKLSEGLYAALGKDTKRLSKQIAAEISRGISNAATYEEIARNIANFSNIPKNNAARIARTEAHRIQNKATADAQWKAKEKGADIVKQWDSTLDGKTRESHRKLDGQIRELDEPFEVNGMKAMQPGDFGDPAEDCNCRCVLLQRARWALDDEELATLKERAEFFGYDKSDDFEDFKKKYLNTSEKPTVQLKNYEEDFMKMTDGYSYDDFIKDFGSIEDGFEGSSDEEIKKAKTIAEKIKSLRNELNVGNNKNGIRPKQESIEILKTWGIDFNDNSSQKVSDELLGKYTDFITDFENTHSAYFGKNKLNLKSISIVDEIKTEKAGGIYRSKNNSIEIKMSYIKSKQAIVSKSDDNEMHVLAHEFGHYISDTLEKNYGSYSDNTEADIVKRAINRMYDGDIFKSVKDLKDCLSSYGSTSYQEAFAEAFAEAYTCKEPRKFARLFKEELEKALKGSQ